MEKFRIEGGRRLSGEVRVSGSKNAALPCLAATLLTSEAVTLRALPRVRDIVTMERVLAALGESCEHGSGVTRAVAGRGDTFHAPYELVRTMRASVLVLGPLLARRRRARVALPGGCAIGARPVDYHLEALARLGADLRIESGDVVAEAPHGLHGAEHTVIPDRIEAGTYVIAAALAGAGVTVARCRPDHLEALLSVLREMGVRFATTPDAIAVPEQPGRARAASLTTAEYPGFATDLQAQFLTLATQAEGRSSVTEAIFENRFQHVLELKRLGAAIAVDGGTAHVTGPTPLDGTTVMASDLRASASLVLAGLVAGGETVVDRIYHLDRGYEAMEEKLNALGARVERFNPGPYQ